MSVPLIQLNIAGRRGPLLRTMWREYEENGFRNPRRVQTFPWYHKLLPRAVRSYLNMRADNVPAYESFALNLEYIYYFGKPCYSRTEYAWRYLKKRVKYEWTQLIGSYRFYFSPDTTQLPTAAEYVKQRKQRVCRFSFGHQGECNRIQQKAL